MTNEGPDKVNLPFPSRYSFAHRYGKTGTFIHLRAQVGRRKLRLGRYKPRWRYRLLNYRWTARYRRQRFGFGKLPIARQRYAGLIAHTCGRRFR